MPHTGIVVGTCGRKIAKVRKGCKPPSASGFGLKIFVEISTLWNHEYLSHGLWCLSLIRTPALLCTMLFSLAAFSCSSHGKSNPSELVEPNLSSIQKEIFDENCNAPSCHGSGRKGDLSLVAGNSFGQLLGVRSTADKKNFPPFLRVKPGSPDSSLLFIKITVPDTSQGELMPKGADKLTQNSVNAIRQWILNGAPDN
jgi:hypothetical protein